MKKIFQFEIKPVPIDECYIDYCIYCEKHKHIARKDFCYGKIRSGNICKDCLSLLVKQTGSSQ